VFPDNKLPEQALPEAEFVRSLVQSARKNLDNLQPTDRKSFLQAKEVLLPAWQHTLQVEIPREDLWSESIYLRTGSYGVTEKLFLGRHHRGDRLPAVLFLPEDRWRGPTVILVHPEGKAPFLDKDGGPAGLARQLLAKKIGVLVLDTFLTGELANWEISNARKQNELFFATYNRTDAQQRAQDVITAATFLKQKRKMRTVTICGVKRAGLWSLLAAPASVIDSIAADCSELDSSSDESLVQPDLFVPGLRRVGSLDGIASLAAPNPLLLFNTGTKFDTSHLRAAYAANKAGKNLRIEEKILPDNALATELAEFK
jgi:hypothetical protein